MAGVKAKTKDRAAPRSPRQAYERRVKIALDKLGPIYIEDIGRLYGREAASLWCSAFITLRATARQMGMLPGVVR